MASRLWRIDRAAGALAATFALLLAVGCGGSSSKPPASAKDITCQEVKTSTKQANALAQQVASEIKRVTAGSVIVSFDIRPSARERSVREGKAQ